ncbi:MAG: copper amine oxidase [Peptococcaceae bacterium]|nr:copper amine oxidase [Peptococcaceae bacterium]
MIIKRISRIVLLIAAMLLLSIPAAAATTVTPEEIKHHLDKTAAYLLGQEKEQNRPLSPWSYIALATSGRDLDGTMVLQSCAQQLELLQPDDELNNYSLLLLTLLAAGQDPHNFKGHNLVARLQAAQLPDGKFADNIDHSGAGAYGQQVLLNAHVWAVLALHAAGAECPDEAKARQWLIDQQHPDGGFNWNLLDAGSDVDSTGMTLTALGLLGERQDSPAVQKAVNYLKQAQENNGGFASWGAVNPESCSYVIEGLTAVGIDPLGTEWTKPGGNMASAILSHSLPDGSFEHTKGGGSNPMATEQSLIGLSDVYYVNTVVERLQQKNQYRRVVKFTLGATAYQVVENGQKQVMNADAAPFLENDRTYVPVRYLALALGIPESGISWLPDTQTVELSHNGITVTMAIGDNVIYINNQPLTMDVVPLIKPPGRTFLPARYVAEAFGYQVSWQGQDQTVTIAAK